MAEFVGFPKVPRLSRECVITEKIDGTNGQVHIIPTLEGMDLTNCVSVVRLEAADFAVFAGSKNQYVMPGKKDNHGFAGWVADHAAELAVGLGPGRHYGEWWGKCIQRGYGQREKRFSLFNVGRWIPDESCRVDSKQQVPPPCCDIVPVLYEGPFDLEAVDACLCGLDFMGSVAAPGFMDPEGIILFHKAAGCLFKKTLKNDEGKNEKESV